MRNKILLPILLFSIIKADAQSKWGVSFTPSFLNTTSVSYGLQLGAEYNFSQRWGVLTELAVPVSNNPVPTFSDEHFFRIKPEIRYFLSKKKIHSGVYTGLQLSYSLRNWKRQDGSYFEEQPHEDSATVFSSASVRSPVFTSSAQIGTVFAFGKHFGLDVFMGAGVRVIHTTYSDVVSSGKVYGIRPNCMILFSPDPAWSINGTVTRPHFNVGLRILYRF